MFSEKEKKSMDCAMYSWKGLVDWILCSSMPYSWSANSGSHMLGRTLLELKVNRAQATVASDRQMILSKIAVMTYGGNTHESISQFKIYIIYKL